MGAENAEIGSGYLDLEFHLNSFIKSLFKLYLTAKDAKDLLNFLFKADHYQ
jgi:hypothetical protein